MNNHPGSSGRKKLKVILRQAVKEDIEAIFEWRNDPVTRKNSFNTRPVTLTEHRRWVMAMLDSPTSSIYIAMLGGKRIGSIRFDSNNENINTSVMLNPAFRGQGLGAEVIKKGVKLFFGEKKPDKPLIAEIKIGNVPSRRAFEKAGFRQKNITYVYKARKKTNEK